MYEIVVRRSDVRKFEVYGPTLRTPEDAAKQLDIVAKSLMADGFKGRKNGANVYQLFRHEDGQRVRLSVSVRRAETPAFSLN